MWRSQAERNVGDHEISAGADQCCSSLSARHASLSDCRNTGIPWPAPVRQHRTATAGAAAATAPATTVPVPAAVARSVPVAVRIPAIGLAVWLTQLGLNANGTVAGPDQCAGAQLVLTRTITRASRFRGDSGPRGLDQRARSLLPASDPAARQSDRDVKSGGWRHCDLQGDLSRGVPKDGVPRPEGLRLEWIECAPIGDLRGRLRRSDGPLPVQHRCLFVLRQSDIAE